VTGPGDPDDGSVGRRRFRPRVRRRQPSTTTDNPGDLDGPATRTDGPLDVIDGSTREVLRRLELDVTRRLDGLLHGDHRGLVPGHGTELGETRRYAPGDDVRRIDWNVTARLSEAHIRQTIAERELQTWLLVDRSSRLDFGTATCEKRDLALAAAAAIGFLTARDGNQIGAVLAGRGDPELIPARGSRKHLLRLLHRLAETPRTDGSGVTNLGEGLTRLAALARRRGLVAVISDFQVAPGWDDALAVAARRHDVLAVQLVDPRDRELPDVGVITVRDPATGEQRELATNRRQVREAFAEAAQDRQRRLEAAFHRLGVDHLELSTDRAWLDDLVAYVGRRQHRQAAGVRGPGGQSQ
jgi:uncharacterized protein (DUF58 family)